MSIKRVWPFKSIRTLLTVSVLLITIPLVGLLIYNNFYAIHVVRGQVSESYQNSLSLYMSQLDSQLNDVDAYMITLSNKYDLISLSQADSDDDYYLAKLYLNNILNGDIPLYRSLDGFFVYESKRKDYMEIRNNTAASTMIVNKALQDTVTELISIHRQSSQPLTRLWHSYEINNQHYLIDIVSVGDTYLGAWISTDRLIEQLQTLKIGDQGEILLVDNHGIPITKSKIVQNDSIPMNGGLVYNYSPGKMRKYLVVGTHAKRTDFSLIALIPDKHILADLPYLTRLNWIVLAATLLVIPLGLILIRKTIVNPLYKILLAMKLVRKGDWGVRVDMKHSTEEFILLGDSFNSMMTEIQTLRVNVFEEQLNKQREELRRLQLQINPHFFLNSLNIVYNLAKIKDYNLIMEMAMSLIRYFRYLFRSHATFVILQNELEHTENYLKIQRLRFPEQLTWLIEAPNYLNEIPVPPLIIQSFVENSIKHANTLDEQIDIKVWIDLQNHGNESQLVIRITDNGEGFKEEVLKILQTERSLENEQGEHTGIWNVQRRLRLLYGDKAKLRFDNDKDTGGAIVEMLLPSEPEMEGLHEVSTVDSR